MTALERYRAGDEEVRLLLELEPSSDADESFTRGNAVRRAAVVLAVSHFEGFLRSLAEEFVDSINAGRLESRRIPIGLREIHTLPRLQEVIATNDSGQRASILKRLSEIAVFWNDAAKPPPGSLDASRLSRTVTSAKAEKIDALFRNMGANVDVCDGELDCHGGVDGIVSLNIRLALKDAVDCRNDVAHGDSDRKPTLEDVTRYLLFLGAFADRLQRRADALLESIAD